MSPTEKNTVLSVTLLPNGAAWKLAFMDVGAVKGGYGKHHPWHKARVW